MRQRAISSGRTRHQMAKGYSAGATGGLRGGLVLYDDKAFIFPADGKIDAINVKDGTKAFESSLFDPDSGNNPSSGTGTRRRGEDHRRRRLRNRRALFRRGDRREDRRASLAVLHDGESW
ncbi:MAG: hypothetical protein QM736_00645 [Vicinamibacterales bacterium]